MSIPSNAAPSAQQAQANHPGTASIPSTPNPAENHAELSQDLARFLQGIPANAQAPANSPAAPAGDNGSPAGTTPPGAPSPAPVQDPNPAPAPDASAQDADPDVDEPVTLQNPEAVLRALENERAKRKAARSELAALRARLAEHEAAATAPPATPTAPEPEAAPAVQAAPDPAAFSGPLAAAATVDTVNTMVRNAARAESFTLGVLTKLNQNRTDAAIADLKQDGITTINGTPIDEADPAAISDFVVGIHAKCREVQASAPARIQFIRRQSEAGEQAVKLLPSLKDPKSQEFAMFRTAIEAMPQLRQNPEWPSLVATYILGKRATQAPQSARLASPPPQPARPLPGAPAVAVSARPPASTLEDAYRPIAQGAMLQEGDVESFARQFVRANLKLA